MQSQGDDNGYVLMGYYRFQFIEDDRQYPVIRAVPRIVRGNDSYLTGFPDAIPQRGRTDRISEGIPYRRRLVI
jgi:hypothetical protein